MLIDENLAELVRMTNEEIEALSQEESTQIKMLNSQLRDVDSRLEHFTMPWKRVSLAAMSLLREYTL